MAETHNLSAGGDPSPDDDNDNWQSQPHYPEVVEILKRDMEYEQQQLVDATECFGHAWIDSDGECPEASECVLAPFCQQAWNMVQVTIGRGARQPKPPDPNKVTSELHSGNIAKPSAARPLGRTKKKKHKYAESDKYTRSGYEDEGRHVDVLVKAFMDVLGDLPQLPPVWAKKNFQAKFGHLGPNVVSAARSYHSLLHNGITVVRFWTNASRTAIVDIAPELLQSVQAAAAQLANGSVKPALEPPTTVPQASWAKLAPCTHRTRVRTVEAAEALAKLVRDQYSL